MYILDIFSPRRLIVHLCVTKEVKNTYESLLLSNVNVRVPNTKHNPKKQMEDGPFHPQFLIANKQMQQA